MEWIKYSVAVVLLFILEVLYFRVAIRYGIVDHPNDRTLHQKPTIRGGGIIFLITPWLFAVLFGGLPWWLLAGISIIGVTSLMDDIRDLPNRVRLSAQFLAMALVFWKIGAFDTDPVSAIVFLVIAVGAVNAYNFMDGINGITGGYSLIALLTLLVLNQYVVHFTANSWLTMLVVAVMIFNYFNFRTRARCFAGDVGSITIAFITVYLIAVLILQTGSFVYVLLLSVYGVDSVLTIIHRMLRKENIFRAHRSHLFQVVVFHGGIPHLKMSLWYMVIQGLVNAVVLNIAGKSPVIQAWVAVVVLSVLALLYIGVKRHYLRIFPARTLSGKPGPITLK